MTALLRFLKAEWWAIAGRPYELVFCRESLGYFLFVPAKKNEKLPFVKHPWMGDREELDRWALDNLTLDGRLKK